MAETGRSLILFWLTSSVIQKIMHKQTDGHGQNYDPRDRASIDGTINRLTSDFPLPFPHLNILLKHTYTINNISIPP